MRYLSFIRTLHEQLAPEAYLEIGIREGGSLSLASCRAVGIDPAYAIRAELDADVALFRTSSDEYFSRPEPLAPTGGQPFELAFIDGLHLFEFALRDFINTERHSSARSMIIFDDVLPRSVREASRQRPGRGAWTGDIYQMLAVFARYRPDLFVVPVDTQPTGLLLVFGLDPSDTTLSDNYDLILDEFLQPDPQPVPNDLIRRLTVVQPHRIVESGVLGVLAAATTADTPSDLRSELESLVANNLGHGFAFPQTQEVTT